MAERVIVVTGGAQGIGRAIAEGLAADGASVVIADLAGADATAAALGDRHLGVAVDVSSSCPHR